MEARNVGPLPPMHDGVGPGAVGVLALNCAAAVVVHAGVAFAETSRISIVLLEFQSRSAAVAKENQYSGGNIRSRASKALPR